MNYPLFGPLPEEAGVFSSLTVFVTALVITLISYWVYRDAKSRGNEWAWQWGWGIFILSAFGLLPGLLALIAYLYKIRDNEPTV